MTNNTTRKRLFPNYTTAEIKSWLAHDIDEATGAKAREEIAARESGSSKHSLTPQSAWGCAVMPLIHSR